MGTGSQWSDDTMKDWINRRFGTWRGLLRLVLAYAELATGRLRAFRLRYPVQVQRVVYVCLGNICRSAYGDKVARELGLHVASVGLSTTTGAASPVEAVAAAHRQGVDLHGHRAVDLGDFKVRPGDLFLVMEVRQAHELRRRIGPRTDVQVCLLGMWCAPVMPHLHDPFSLSAGYFDSCFVRVRQATVRLNQALSGAAKSTHPPTAPTIEVE
jgi:protein-tyrosine phosphatase